MQLDDGTGVIDCIYFEVAASGRTARIVVMDAADFDRCNPAAYAPYTFMPVRRGVVLVVVVVVVVVVVSGCCCCGGGGVLVVCWWCWCCWWWWWWW